MGHRLPAAAKNKEQESADQDQKREPDGTRRNAAPEHDLSDFHGRDREDPTRPKRIAATKRVQPRQGNGDGGHVNQTERHERIQSGYDRSDIEIVHQTKTKSRQTKGEGKQHAELKVRVVPQVREREPGAYAQFRGQCVEEGVSNDAPVAINSNTRCLPNPRFRRPGVSPRSLHRPEQAQRRSHRRCCRERRASFISASRQIDEGGEPDCWRKSFLDEERHREAGDHNDHTEKQSRSADPRSSGRLESRSD